MNYRRDDNGAPRGEGAAADSIAVLVREAGPRKDLPQAIFDRLHATTRAVWREELERRRFVRRRSVRRLLIAALVTVTLGLGWVLGRLDSTSPEAEPGRGVGAVVAVHGAAGSTWRPGARIDAGDVIETRAGEHVVLAFGSGTSIRLDNESQLRVDERNRFALLRGAVYVDVGEAGGRISVETPFGVARDIGTLFEARLLDEGLRVIVREGAVVVDRGDTEHRADAGEALVVREDGVTRELIGAADEAWSWILAAPMPFELEGATLAAFLDWVARETGWRIAYQDMALEREVATIVTHGSVAGVRPDIAAASVLPGANLDYELQGGVLHLRRR